MGDVKITTPADPEKLKAYRESKEYKKVHPHRVDKMGRKLGEKVKMTKERADYILDMREANRLRDIYRD